MIDYRKMMTLLSSFARNLKRNPDRQYPVTTVCRGQIAGPEFPISNIFICTCFPRYCVYWV